MTLPQIKGCHRYTKYTKYTESFILTGFAVFFICLVQNSLFGFAVKPDPNHHFLKSVNQQLDPNHNPALWCSCTGTASPARELIDGRSPCGKEAFVSYPGSSHSSCNGATCICISNIAGTNLSHPVLGFQAQEGAKDIAEDEAAVSATSQDWSKLLHHVTPLLSLVLPSPHHQSVEHLTIPTAWIGRGMHEAAAE